MDFVEILFPEDISVDASGGPEFYTSIVLSASGMEHRNINWKESRNRYDVSHGVKTQKQIDEIFAFFYARKGRAVGFRFRDWSDYVVSNQTIGVCDGIVSKFQLIKKYVSGSCEYIRKITKPVDGTLNIEINGVRLDSDKFSVNYTDGIVSLQSPPSKDSVIVASFLFDVPVRFNSDRLIVNVDENGMYVWDDISLIEIRA